MPLFEHPAATLVKGLHLEALQYRRQGGTFTAGARLSINHKIQGNNAGVIRPDIIQFGGGLFHFAVVEHHAQPVAFEFLGIRFKAGDEFLPHPVPDNFVQTALERIEKYNASHRTHVGLMYIPSDTIEEAFRASIAGELDHGQPFLYNTKVGSVLKMIDWLKTHQHEDLLLIHAPEDQPKELLKVIAQVFGVHNNDLSANFIDKRSRRLLPGVEPWQQLTSGK